MDEYTAITIAMRRDPKVGTRLDLPALVDTQGHRVKLPLTGPVTALLYFRNWEHGSFDGDVQMLEGETVAYPQVKTCVVYALGDPKEVGEHVRAKGYRSVFLYDEQGKVGDLLNAFVTARSAYIDRFYLLKGDGTLLYVENPLDEDEKVIAEAKEIIGKVLSSE